MGREAYNAMLRDEELLPFNSDEIECIGRDELAHGWAVQIWMEQLAKERGTPIGPQSGGGIAPGGPALIAYYRERIAQLRDYVKQHTWWIFQTGSARSRCWRRRNSCSRFRRARPCFAALFSKARLGFILSRRRRRSKKPPRTWMPIRISTAIASFHWRARSDARALFCSFRLRGAIRILCANPGQRRIRGRLGVLWRRAFRPDGPLRRRSRRALLHRAMGTRARGASDRGSELASGTWTFDQAVQFFAHETGFSPEQAKAAVSVIALGPGYVIAYTAGRRQIETLLPEYWAKAGANASLHDFHVRLLCYGTTPLSIVGPELLGDLNKPLAAVRASAGY